jgi:putative endopeptidase
MNAQLVNAVNLPVQNAMNFPAAILQRPFFDPAADPAYNYGAIGGVIGHEISHSFDDAGSAFDRTGLMRNWWTPADLATFQKNGKALSDQYDSYEALPGLHVNGNLTLGENIADLGGLNIAYDALQRAQPDSKPTTQVGGLSRDQRFFLNWGTVWRRNFTPDELNKRLVTDPHAPANFRAIGAPSNMPAFAAAFQCKAGDKMVRSGDKQIVIW